MGQSPLNNPLESFSFSAPDLLWLLFYLATIIFTIHVIVIAYHWFTFGTERKIPTIAVSVYIGIGALILIALATTISLIT